MGRRLPDQVAIVTGAGSVGPGWGNGKATAGLFAREGASEFAVDINQAAAEEAAKKSEAERKAKEEAEFEAELEAERKAQESSES